MSALTRLFLWLGLLASTSAVALAATASAATFPRELSTYAQSPAAGLWSVLQARVAAEPFNLAATLQQRDQCASRQHGARVGTTLAALL